MSRDFDSVFKDRNALTMRDFSSGNNLFENSMREGPVGLAPMGKDFWEKWLNEDKFRISLFIKPNEEILACGETPQFGTFRIDGQIKVFLTTKKILINCEEGIKKNTWTILKPEKIGGMSVRCPGTFGKNFRIALFMDSVGLEGSPLLRFDLWDTPEGTDFIKVLNFLISK